MQSHTFLSTLSLRRATARCQQHRHSQRISIHALLAESDTSGSIIPAIESISIHALLAESDFLRAALCDPQTEFLSTLSLRRATYIGPEMEDANGISIHALLAESDHPPAPQRRWQPYFYPRSPCGERRCKHRHHAGHSGISIHALLAESDKELKQEAGIIQQFLSTLSLRRATPPFLPQHCKVSNFYPRSPCGERQHIK